MPDAYGSFDFLRNQFRLGTERKRDITLLTGASFTRASVGYAQDNAGVLVSFASGALRRTDKGVLIEGARTNLCLQSQTFDNASWTKNQSSITADAVAAPDGTTTADKLIEDSAGSSVHDCVQGITKAASAITYAFSIYCKAAERTIVRVGFDAGSSTNQVFAIFNLGTGAIHTASAVSGSYASPSEQITALSGGWYRCSVIATTGTETTVRPRVMLHDGSGITYTGDGASGLYLWGAQLEAASCPSSYVPTTTASATRAADVLTVPVSGLDYPLSLYAEFEPAVLAGANREIFHIDAGAVDAGNNRAWLRLTSGELVSALSNSGGVTQATPSATGAVVVGTQYKCAARFNTNTVRLAKTGVLATEDTTATNPSAPTDVRFGSNSAGGAQSFVYLRRAAIWPRALTDAELQARTT